MERLLPQNKVFIKTIYRDDEALASYYGFSDKDQIHYYQSGFYSKYANRYSPLFLLVCNEIRESIKNDMIFDFMFSDEINSYKNDQYAAQNSKMYRLKWTPQKFRFFAFQSAKTIQDIMLKLIEIINKNKFKA
jgi:hypothetical protein